MIETSAMQMKEELIALRRALHKIPETEFEEYQTTKFIQNQLAAWEIPYQVLAKTGVVALISGKRPGKTILLRADIDGLPMQELAEVSYKSQRDGFMHACGHDVHTACLLGAAKILREHSQELAGNVKLVFQPAEEGDGGALPMIDAGVLENPPVDAAFALHVEPLAETGTLQFKNGPIMASPDNFSITITGKGGHGAAPHKCVDPILTAAKIIENMQALISRELNPMTPAVVSVCSLHAGTCHNVIPDTAELLGTARSLTPQAREFLATRMEEIATNTANAMGAECKFQFDRLFPPVINDKTITEFAANAAKQLSCVKQVEWLDDASMAGDDFAYFLQKVPGSYFKLGVGNKAAGICEPIHSSKFRVDEDALPIGTAVLAKIAIDYLNIDNNNIM